MSDDREDLAELVASRRGPTAHTHDADREVADRIMKAGWVRIDPADPAVIDRVARTLHPSFDQHIWTVQEGMRTEARAVLAALGGDQATREPNTSGPWDIGDPDPGQTVTVVVDDIGTLDDIGGGGDHAEWHRTVNGEEWKSYKDGGKVYLSWAELVRRWGPVRLRNAGDQR